MVARNAAAIKKLNPSDIKATENAVMLPLIISLFLPARNAETKTAEQNTWLSAVLLLLSSISGNNERISLKKNFFSIKSKLFEH